MGAENSTDCCSRVQIFRKTTEAELAAKEHGTALPGWAKAVGAPGRLSEHLIERIRQLATVSPHQNTSLPWEYKSRVLISVTAVAWTRS